ncbi:MAG: VOC family protein [Nocardioides sp.]
MPRALHHFDLWVRDAAAGIGEWGWLLGEVGWAVEFEEAATASWQHDDGTYAFLQAVVDEPGHDHDRMLPGINHLALTIDTRAALGRLRAESSEHGWHELFADRYPHAGGEDHTALYLENAEGFEVEIVVGD